MSKMTKWICAALALIVAGGTLMVFTGLRHGFDPLNYSTESRGEAVTYPVKEPFTDIDAQSDLGDIELRRATDGKCSVVILQDEGVKASVEVKNGTLIVRREEKTPLSFSSSDKQVVIYLPEKEYGALLMKSSAGDLGTCGVFRFRSAELSSESGDIFFDSECAEDLILDSSSGDQRIAGSRCGSVSMHSTSGELKTEGLSCGSFSGESTSGDQEYLSLQAEELNVKTTSGEIDLTDVEVKKAARAESTSGDIHLERADAESFRIHSSSGDVSGSILRPMDFRTETSSGDVHLPDPDRGAGEFFVHTSSGDINIRLAK